MLPFLTGHWRINEQVAKRQCNYIDGFFPPEWKKGRLPRMHTNNLDKKKGGRREIKFFHLHRGRFTYTSFELVKRVGAHYSHGAVSLPNPGAYRPAG